MYAQGKTDSLAVVGLILAMYGLSQGIIGLPLGIMADWVGWLKPFIVVRFALAGVGALADVMGIRAMFGVTAFFCLMAGLLGARSLDVSARN